ncbi:hypothetical protein [Arthrobacter humicola]
MDNPVNSTNSIQKIGINKLGTLLSSQTTDTPGATTTRPTGHSVADRSGATFQTYPISRIKANQHFCDLPVIETNPAVLQHAK